MGGVSAWKLLDAGFRARDLWDAGLHAELLDACFSTWELRDAGFNTWDLRDAGFSAWELRDAGFSSLELQGVGFYGSEPWPTVLCSTQSRHRKVHAKKRQKHLERRSVGSDPRFRGGRHKVLEADKSDCCF